MYLKEIFHSSVASTKAILREPKYPQYDLTNQENKMSGDAATIGSVAISMLPAAWLLGDPITLGTLIIQLLLPVLVLVVFPLILFALQAWISKNRKQIIKIRSKTGDKIIEVEYDPKSGDPEELTRLIATLTEASELKKGD